MDVAGEEDAGWRSPLESEALMCASMVVPGEVELELVVEVVERGVDLAQESRLVKLPKQCLVEALTAAICPSMPRFDESELDVEPTGQVVEGVGEATWSVFPSG